MRFLFIGSRFTLHASFPHSVTLMQLRFTSFTVTSSWRDLHPQECAHAGRTKERPDGIAAPAFFMGDRRPRYQRWPIQARIRAMVGSDSVVEIRMARDMPATSRWYSSASMNGPVPIGMAASSTALSAHRRGSGRIQ
ncbi:MAG: hypothetical protein GAK35_04237 [Herbaspirillum frisingense]|uniref:Uncharacterized protein n=1 Tax=Herbaspirillum frisingense TaxID=92645 RepID=A0A7V8FSS6_9BURK|nr:MAG: hypothetical protein GAK35_04237 [Herbaspirillum frisingense]